jgi:hypothetical protein
LAGTLGVALGQEVKNVGQRVRTKLRRGEALQDKYVSADDNDFLMESALESCMEKIRYEPTTTNNIELARVVHVQVVLKWF